MMHLYLKLNFILFYFYNGDVRASLGTHQLILQVLVTRPLEFECKPHDSKPLDHALECEDPKSFDKL